MNNVLDILNNTPWWVYLLFFYLVYIGLKASRTRIIPLYKLFIIPVVFFYLSIHTLMNDVKIDLFSVSIWSLATLVSLIAGIAQAKKMTVKFDKANKLVQLPGTWSTLIIILIIFAAKYYFGYELAADPTLAKNTVFEFAILAVTGACSGLFVGRLLGYLYQFATTKPVNLKTL